MRGFNGARARAMSDSGAASTVSALAVVLNARVNDVLAEHARLRARIAALEEEVEVWSAGAAVPEVGRYYAIDSSVLAFSGGCCGANWHGCLDDTDVDIMALAQHGIVSTPTHRLRSELAFRYLGSKDTEWIKPRKPEEPFQNFFDREHAFAAPYLGTTMDREHDPEECPAVYTDDGLAIVFLRQRFLHDVHPLDENGGQVLMTGAEGTYGGVPKWLAWQSTT